MKEIKGSNDLGTGEPGDVLLRYTVLNLTTSLCYYQSEEEPTTKIINVSNSKDDISKSLLYINYENNVFEKQKQERIWFDQTRRILKNIFS